MHQQHALPSHTPAAATAGPGAGPSRRAVCLQAAGLVTGAWCATWAPAHAATDTGPVANEAGFWQQLAQGGCVALMCHSHTDAAPDAVAPADFDFKVCATQPNLNDRGRSQARSWGAQFVQRRVPLTEVRTSAWCVGKDTARLAFGRYRIWSPLNAFLPAEATEKHAIGQTSDVNRFIASLRTPRNTVLVTHPANITALTAQVPAMGEILLIRPFASEQANTPPGNQYAVLARWHLGI